MVLMAGSNQVTRLLLVIIFVLILKILLVSSEELDYYQQRQSWHQENVLNGKHLRIGTIQVCFF